jgi:hypothetical protein
MARTIGNSEQEAGLRELLSGLVTVRKFSDVRSKYMTVLTPTYLLVKLDLPDFPVISIGTKKGFGMPDIPSYANVSDRRTPFEACLQGDEYVRKLQGRGSAASSPYRNLLWESD